MYLQNLPFVLVCYSHIALRDPFSWYGRFHSDYPISHHYLCLSTESNDFKPNVLTISSSFESWPVSGACRNWGTKSAFSLYRTFGPPRTECLGRTSDPPEMEWKGLVRSTSDALSDVRPFVSNQSNGLPRSTKQRSIVPGLILGSLEREIRFISWQYSLN